MGHIALRSLPGALGRIACSVAGAGLFYAAWMAAFLLVTGRPLGGLEAVVWLLAPAITAGGFAVGILVAERITGTGPSRFLRLYLWPLVGCAVGAGTVYWFGPMLIVFGMFAGGTLGIGLRETLMLVRRARA